MRRWTVTSRIVIGVALAALVAAAPAVVAAPRAHLTQQEESPIPSARKPTEAERKAATEAIEAQLKAFKADDYQTAWKYQSSSLKEVFDGVEQFRSSMKRGYPQFANYKSVTFTDAASDKSGDRVAIQVKLVGEDGVTVQATYLMLKEKGEYKVESVFGGARVKPAPRDVA
jgi:hypothetical protein